MNPTNPSPPEYWPRAVSHAESVTSEAFKFQPRWISPDSQAAIKYRFSSALASAGLASRSGTESLPSEAEPVVDHTVGRQMDERELPGRV